MCAFRAVEQFAKRKNDFYGKLEAIILEGTIYEKESQLWLAFAIFTAHHFLEGRMKSMIRKS